MCLAFLAACGTPPARPRAPDEPAARSQLAEEDRFVPPYARADLTRALITERGAEATGEQLVAELAARDPSDAATDERYRVALADLGVRRRFIESLEQCEAAGRWCPPRLDDPPWSYDLDDTTRDPPLDGPLRFDLDSWRKLAAELHGRACACRTIACVDSVGVAIDRLEPRPMRSVQGDDTATIALTRARECLFRLRGRAARPRPPAPVE